ncbi:MAG: sodium-translocating pyrophosphatase [Pirellulaceae bacterium]|nr:sodium-translocating pyrophosphatase [Pirellulaceae bacterium]
MNSGSQNNRWLGVFRWLTMITMGIVALVLISRSQLYAQNGSAAEEPAVSGLGAMEYVYWGISFIGSLVALWFARQFYKSMMEADEGTPRMIEIAGYVRDGAQAYLTQQYKIVALFFVVIFGLLCVASFGMNVQSKFVPFAFITGGFFSGLAGFFGMKTATWASSRTAAGAQKSLNAGLQVAFRSGAVMGLTVVGLGLLDITVWYAVLRWLWPMCGGGEMRLEEITVTMLCFGMGASSQALFARVGGGIFTKAADVGADLVGKVEQGIPEDDPRNPATIADNVGDNVGDVAGMGADLYESYCGSILATAALGVAAFASPEAYGLEGDAMSWQLKALLLPMVIAGIGIFLSLIGINVVKTDEDASQKALLKALATGINLSTVLVAVAGFFATWMILGRENLGIAGSICVGLLSGWLIGKWTEYSTSDEFQPTKDLAGQAVTGPATVIIAGVADGMKSVWVPVVVVCGATLLAFGFASHGNFADVSHFALGVYGVGIAAVGMLSTLGITLATDAYGPIADNAGGNAEMAGLDPIVRERTDALDSLGNTTAATGKGFAIGSAALTALALMAAYIEEVRIGFERWADDPKVVEVADAPGFHKIGSQFIIQHEPGKEGDEVRSGWLVFPDDARKPGWSSIKTAKGPVALNGSIAEIRGEGHKRRTLVLKGDGKGEEADRTLSLISVKSATLPDYARYYDASLLNPKILVGVFLGCMTTFVFCAMTMKAVGRAAQGMVEEVRRQFREKPGIMDGSEMPDYTRPVAISTKSALKEMILPSLLGLCMPIAVGVLLGVGGVLGLLVGTLTCGFCLAVFMANAGGAWDNAKKYIEAGNYGGKGSEAHKAGVVGDTVGDPFKDTSGPSLNILIKLMSMVSVVAAGLIVRYSLTAMGIF